MNNGILQSNQVLNDRHLYDNTFIVGDLVEIKERHAGWWPLYGIIISEGKHHLGKWYDVYDVDRMKVQLHCESELRKLT